ncbi:MAG: hypothetical protein ACOH2Q_08995 [Rhodococcus sp. (in: high G+C Gram-positive bacteria)]
MFTKRSTVSKAGTASPVPGSFAPIASSRFSGTQVLGARSSLYLGALAAATAISAVIAIGSVIGLITDPTQITGAAAWLKPLKFAISIAVYCATVAWLLTFLRSRPRAAARIGRITAIALILELLLIDIQVVRGQPSHFNTSTAFDAVVFQLMGAFAAVAFCAAAAVAVLLLREPDLPQPLGTGLRAAMVVTAIGMALGVVIIAAGAHTVGAPDGGPGLPLTGWSIAHGDLRVAHFVGLHALQVIPFGVWLMTRIWPTLTAHSGRHVVRVGAAFYVGILALLTWQAARGQAVLQPDWMTLAGGGAWSMICVAAATARLRWQVAPRPQTHIL